MVLGCLDWQLSTSRLKKKRTVDVPRWISIAQLSLRVCVRVRPGVDIVLLVCWPGVWCWPHPVLNDVGVHSVLNKTCLVTDVQNRYMLSNCGQVHKMEHCPLASLSSSRPSQDWWRGRSCPVNRIVARHLPSLFLKELTRVLATYSLTLNPLLIFRIVPSYI